jgi:hypothetical protein
VGHEVVDVVRGEPGPDPGVEQLNRGVPEEVPPVVIERLRVADHHVNSRALFLGELEAGSDKSLGLRLDEDAVRAILEPAGLWDKVLSFDEKKLKDLVTDTTVAREVRDRLAGLKQVISTSTRLWVRKREEEE